VITRPSLKLKTKPPPANRHNLTDPRTPAKIPDHSLSRPHTRMITIYHNPRCSKSRGACELVNDVYNLTNEPVEVVEYLRTPLSISQLKDLNRMLGCPVRDMLRDTESVYKELGLADTSLSDDQLYEAIAANPILLQRPIVVRNGRAVIGRPPENVQALFPDVAK
jgi:arsenate reductase